MPRRTKTIFRVPLSSAAFAAAIEGLVQLNQRILQGRVPPGRTKFPPLIDSGIVYKKERRDTWRDIRQVFKTGWGDCEDLAAIRVAQLRESGRDPGARVKVYKSGKRKYHAIVIRSDGSTWDPSRALGMLPGGRSPYGTLEGTDVDHDLEHDDYLDEDLEGDDSLEGRKEKARRQKKRRLRAYRMARWCARKHKREPIGTDGAWVSVGDDPLGGDPHVTFDLYKSGRGWSGVVRVPLKALRKGIPQALIAKTSPSKKRRRRKPKRRRKLRRGRRRKKTTRRSRRRRAKQSTASKAVRLASRIANLPGVSAIIPPQASTALKILKGPIGKLASKGVGKLLKSIF